MRGRGKNENEGEDIGGGIRVKFGKDCGAGGEGDLL